MRYLKLRGLALFYIREDIETGLTEIIPMLMRVNFLVGY